MAFQQELQHIFFRQSVDAGVVVQQGFHLATTKFCNAGGLEIFHDLLHLRKARRAFKLIGIQGVQAVAVALVQFLQLVQQADASRLVIAEHFADQEGGIHRVLVPHIGTAQVAVAFFKTENVGIGFPLLFQ